MRTLLSALLALPFLLLAQTGEDTSRSVAGGGISVSGWMGAVDPGSTATVSQSKLAQEGASLHVTTGPATTYWSPKNKATGNYTVSATFTEPKFMDLNSHPHPYGIMIGGNDMGTPQQTFLYCAAYGNGSFIVRGFGPQAFQLNGRRESNSAVHQASGPGQSVTQEIAVSVNNGKVTCSINGTAVGSYESAAVVGTGKLKSTDGVYGIRSAHNTDVLVSGLKLTAQ